MSNQYDIYCDGSIEGGNPGGWGVGGWIIKLEDRVVARGTIDLGKSIFMTNNKAEYAAVKDAIHTFKRLLSVQGKTDYSVVAHSDSKLVVEQLNDNWNCNNEDLKLYRDEIWKMCEDMDVEFKWIPREENSEADEQSRSLYADI